MRSVGLLTHTNVEKVLVICRDMGTPMAFWLQTELLHTYLLSVSVFICSHIEFMDVNYQYATIQFHMQLRFFGMTRKWKDKLNIIIILLMFSTYHS